jgi:hypothetical protein
LQTFLEAGLIAVASDAPQGDASHDAALAERSAADSLTNQSSLSEANPSTVPSPAGVSSSSPGSPVSADLEKARQYILEVAEETLGPDATSFTDKLARLQNTEEMLHLARNLRDVLYRFINVQEADQFLETVREIAPKA